MKGDGIWNMGRDDFVKVRKAPLSLGEYKEVRSDPPYMSWRHHGWNSAVKGTCFF